MTTSPLRGFLDESSANRGPRRQEYLLATALVPREQCDGMREHLRAMLPPGQTKLHWRSESPPRRRAIAAAVAELGVASVVVTHLGTRTRRTERYRHACLETMYGELLARDVTDLTLECRGPTQDLADRAHIVALQGRGLARGLHIRHERGGDEPLLWIPDAVLGAINADYLGEPAPLATLSRTIDIIVRTPRSLVP